MSKISIEMEQEIIHMLNLMQLSNALPKVEDLSNASKLDLNRPLSKV